MRYKVRFGNSPDMFSICYAENQADAAMIFHTYHPHLTITTIEEFPPEKPQADIYDLIEECDPEEVIRYLVEAIEDIGVADQVAGYLYRRGFGR